MSKSLPFLALTFAILTVPGLVSADDNDLFSDVRTDSVFGRSSAGSSNSGGGSPRRTRITSAEALRDMLKSTGFEAKVLNSRVVTTQKELSPWTFPVLVQLSEDETRVTITLGLRSIKDLAKELPAAKLLEMMRVSQENAPALFVYHTQRERTEVSSALTNRGLTGEDLRDEVNRLAIVAKDNESMWAGEEESQPQETQPQQPQQPQSPAPQSPAPQQTQPQPNSNPASTTLVGRWSAARSNTEAFAVEFTAGQTFNLVYVNNGQQTKSSGTFTLENGTLSLIGTDGTQTKGTLTLNSGTQFTLTLPNANALVFRKAG